MVAARVANVEENWGTIYRYAWSDLSNYYMTRFSLVRYKYATYSGWFNVLFTIFLLLFFGTYLYVSSSRVCGKIMNEIPVRQQRDGKINESDILEVNCMHYNDDEQPIHYLGWKTVLPSTRYDFEFIVPLNITGNVRCDMRWKGDDLNTNSTVLWNVTSISKACSWLTWTSSGTIYSNNTNKYHKFVRAFLNSHVF